MTRRDPYPLKERKSLPMWRSLEEKHADPEMLREQAEAEHPGGFVHDKVIDPQSMITRRHFVKGSTLAAAAAGVAGCIRRPEEKIVPYSKAPEHLIPGIPANFASVTARGRDALGVVVTSHEGRPTKVEGNQSHPASLGATDVRAQAYVWDLYDPDRSKVPAKREGDALKSASLEEFDAAFAKVIEAHQQDQGAGLGVLSPVSNSPTSRRLKQALLEKYPQAKVYTYSSVNDDNVREGTRMIFGKPYAPVYDYAQAMTIVSLDADFLGSEPGSVRAGRGFGHTRRVASPKAQMSRLYVFESNHSVTGSAADHRFRMPSSRVPDVAIALAQALGVIGGAKAKVQGLKESWLKAIMVDLRANKGRSLIVAGAAQPPVVHALAAAMNAALENVGQTGTLSYGPLVDEEEPSSLKAIQALAADAPKLKTLLILGGNPVYDAPADLPFKQLLERKGLTSIHLASQQDETSECCSWHVPLSHELEAWGDQQALDGTLALQQPLIAPLYQSRSEIEVFGALVEESAKGYELVRKTHFDRRAAEKGFSKNPEVFEGEFENEWYQALYLGAYNAAPPTKPKPEKVPELNSVALASAIVRVRETPRVSFGANNIEVNFRPDPALHDGVHANNLWCLELPDPMTKLVWDNAALISGATRKALGLENGQMVRLSRAGRSIEVPVWTLPGHADWSVTLYLGWGRKAAGAYGNGKGFDAQALRTSDAFFIAEGVSIEALNKSYNLVQTQEHDRMEGRPIAIDATKSEYEKEPEFASYRTVEFKSTPPLWKEVDYGEGHQWGMAIDLSACTGCNACVIACQSENNVPAVGKREVERGREMHWLRMDRYFVGEDDDDPNVALQPVACQQCEEAPCENVCPTNATAHSPEGLNDMSYNRCIGTRYCANNCPYKVRRFNYLEWHAHLDDKWKTYGDIAETRKMQFNPNVTVRMRGVMEKCTYCVQRIQSGKIGAKRDGRKLGGDEVVTACQQVCPTNAIVFGDLNDKRSKVAQLSKRDRQYKLLAEIGTQPRTTYLAKIRNPNPAIEGEG